MTRARTPAEVVRVDLSSGQRTSWRTIEPMQAAVSGERCLGRWIHHNQADKLVEMIPPEDIGAFEAKTRLSELLDKVSRGHVYRITKRGRPVAELRPVAPDSTHPTFGADRGRVEMGDDFDAPVDDFTAYR